MIVLRAHRYTTTRRTARRCPLPLMPTRDTQANPLAARSTAREAETAGFVVKRLDWMAKDTGPQQATTVPSTFGRKCSSKSNESCARYNNARSLGPGGERDSPAQAPGHRSVEREAERDGGAGLPLIHVPITVDFDQLDALDQRSGRGGIDLRECIGYRFCGAFGVAVGDGHVRGEPSSWWRSDPALTGSRCSPSWTTPATSHPSSTAAKTGTTGCSSCRVQRSRCGHISSRRDRWPWTKPCAS